MPTELETWLAAEPTSVVVPVSSQDIAKFATATGATDPVHFDAAIAHRRGYPDVVAPDLFYLSLRTGAFNVVPRGRLHEEGTSEADIPPIRYRTAMAGETSARLHRPFVAGQRVRVTCTRLGASTKEGRSGTLTFLDLRYDYATEGGEPIATEHFTRVFR